MALVQAGVRRHAKKFIVVVVLVFVTLGVGLSIPASGNVQPGGATVGWVSGMGDDANPCSRTAPCKTFAGTLSKTTMPAGMVRALDPGSFGPVTILGQTVVDGGSSLAHIDTASVGITIDADPGEVVTLRNLVIRGTLGGVTGINFVAGDGLILDNVKIEGFSADALRVSSPGAFVHLTNVTFRQNGDNGLRASGSSAGAHTRVMIADSRFEANVNAGVLAGGHTEVSIEGSTSSGNSEGLACVTIAGGLCTMTAIDNVISQNTKGIVVGRGAAESTGRARAWISGNTISENDSGLSITEFGDGKVNSLGDNVVVHNTVNGKPTATLNKV